MCVRTRVRVCVCVSEIKVVLLHTSVLFYSFVHDTISILLLETATTPLHSADEYNYPIEVDIVTTQVKSISYLKSSFVSCPCSHIHR